MEKNIFSRLCLLILLTAVLGCKTKKVIVKAPEITAVPAAGNKKAENIQLLKAKDLPFNTLGMKVRATMDIGGNTTGVNMNIRISKDRQIWASITAIAGIEVARVLITPDSVFVRNNLQSVAVRKPFSYLYRYTGRQLDFKMLQAILSGNTIAELLTPESSLELKDNVFELTGEKSTLAYRALFNTFLKTAVLELNDAKAGQALKVSYSDYQEITGALFPSVIKINTLSGKNKFGLTLDFSKTERNVPLEFPFTVPKRFEIIN